MAAEFTFGLVKPFIAQWFATDCFSAREMFCQFDLFRALKLVRERQFRQRTICQYINFIAIVELSLYAQE